MRNRLLSILATLALTATAAASPALGWGMSGHAVVAEIAQRRLSPVTLARIQALLGSSQSLASIGAWADTHAALNPDTRRWHYVNIPVGSTGYDEARDCASPKPGDCLVGAIASMRARLADRRLPIADRATALRFLVHLIADAHQPLHCAERDGDGGGTRTMVKFFGAQMPLHLVWDFGILDRATFDWGEHVRLATVRVEQENAPAIARGSVVDWIMECHRLAVAVAYDLPGDLALGDAYQGKALPVIHSQLARAGIRLAAVLAEALAQPAPALPGRQR